MKNRQSVLISIVLLLVVSLGVGQAYAGSYVTRASELCKAEAASKYGSERDPVRLKFKGVTGNQVNPRVALQVLPRKSDAFKVYCEVDGRAWQVKAIEQASRKGALRVVDVQGNSLAP